MIEGRGHESRLAEQEAERSYLQNTKQRYGKLKVGSKDQMFKYMSLFGTFLIKPT